MNFFGEKKRKGLATSPSVEPVNVCHPFCNTSPTGFPYQWREFCHAFLSGRFMKQLAKLHLRFYKSAPCGLCLPDSAGQRPSHPTGGSALQIIWYWMSLVTKPSMERPWFGFRGKSSVAGQEMKNSMYLIVIHLPIKCTDKSVMFKDLILCHHPFLRNSPESTVICLFILFYIYLYFNYISLFLLGSAYRLSLFTKIALSRFLRTFKNYNLSYDFLVFSSIWWMCGFFFVLLHDREKTFEDDARKDYYTW